MNYKWKKLIASLVLWLLVTVELGFIFYFLDMSLQLSWINFNFVDPPDFFDGMTFLLMLALWTVITAVGIDVVIKDDLS